MGCRTFVEALRLGPRQKQAKHGVFSLPNIGGFSWEELPLKLGAKGKGKKRPTVGRRKNLLWVVLPTYRGLLRRPIVDPIWAPSERQIYRALSGRP